MNFRKTVSVINFKKQFLKHVFLSKVLYKKCFFLTTHMPIENGKVLEFIKSLI